MIETRNNRENICDETTINHQITEQQHNHQEQRKNNEIDNQPNLNKSFNTSHKNHLKFEYVKIQPNPKPTEN